MTQIPVAYTPLAPVQLLKPNGLVKPYGLGASTDSARGSALASALAAATNGDIVKLYANAEATSSMTLNTGVSLVGVGYPTIIFTTLSTQPGLIVNASSVKIESLKIITNESGIGYHGAATATDIAIRDVHVAVSNVGAAIVWSTDHNSAAGAQSTVQAKIIDCYLSVPAASGANGFGSLLNLDAASVVDFINVDAFGDTDGILASGSSSATVNIYGGYWRSTLDAITSGGATIHCFDVRASGDQADIYGDAGLVTVSGSNYDISKVTGSGGGGNPPQLSIAGTTIGDTGRALLDDTTASGARNTLGASAGVWPASTGGTGASTLTGVIIGNGTSAFTTKTNPSGAFVGTTDTQTLSDKTLTSPTITGTGTIAASTVDAGTITATSYLQTENQLQILDGTSLAFGQIYLDAGHYFMNNNSGAPNGIKFSTANFYDSANDEYAAIEHNDSQYYFYDWNSVLAGISCDTVTSAGIITTTLLTSGAVTFNDAGADVDFRVEGDTDTKLLVVDAGTDTVNIGDNGGFFTGKVNFAQATGFKIALYPISSTVGYGFGIQNQQFQLLTPGTGTEYYAFVSGSSAAGALRHQISGTTNTNTIFNEDGADTDFRLEGDTLQYMFFVDASAATENIAMITNSQPNWQSMDGGLFLGDTSTAPTGNPSSGCFIYSQAGDLKFRTSTGFTGFLSGGQLSNIVSKTSAYTATSNDYTITCDATSAAFTLTLPAAASHTGRILIIKKTDSSVNAVTVDGDSSETIDGATTYDLRVRYQSITIQSDGSNWHVIGKNSEIYCFDIFTANIFNPADATTYYSGASAWTSTANITYCAVQRAGIITRARVQFWVGAVLGTSETATLYLRVNNTTDYTLTSAVVLSGRVYSELVTGLNISVATTDTLELKLVCPTYSTNPTSVQARVYFDILTV